MSWFSRNDDGRKFRSREKMSVIGKKADKTIENIGKITKVKAIDVAMKNFNSFVSQNKNIMWSDSETVTGLKRIITTVSTQEIKKPMDDLSSTADNLHKKVQDGILREQDADKEWQRSLENTKMEIVSLRREADMDVRMR
jgi:hypothetical protein